MSTYFQSRECASYNVIHRRLCQHEWCTLRNHPSANRSGKPLWAPVLLTSEQKENYKHYTESKEGRQRAWPPYELTRGEPEATERLHPPLQKGSQADPMSTPVVSSPSPKDIGHTGPVYWVSGHETRLCMTRTGSRHPDPHPLQEPWVVKWQPMGCHLSNIRV